MFWENNMKLTFQYQKISIYDRFHLNFHKKDLDIEFKLVLFRELSFSYHIISYRILSISNRILSVSCTYFVISSMPGNHVFQCLPFRLAIPFSKSHSVQVNSSLERRKSCQTIKSSDRSKKKKQISLLLSVDQSREIKNINLAHACYAHITHKGAN
jgi:hypothetical protein